jgi:trimeric autotransporter adhesin
VDLPLVANSTVMAMAIDSANEILYLGGVFTTLGPRSGSGLEFNTTTGTRVTTAPEVTGRIERVISDGAGGWYIAGGFSHVAGVARAELAHILPDGTLDLDFAPAPGGAVRAMLLDGATLYVGGDFSSIGGQSRNYLAALSATTGNATSFDPSPRTVGHHGNFFYLGGQFSSAGTAPNGNLHVHTE